ncbi:MAG: ABC transporter ATP-binding protein [Fimbriimonadia bacterium]|jgi:ABC-2 type transport system ATP-binding protein
MTATIETHGLRKKFRSLLGKELVAVDGLDLSVERGSVFGLLGPNGAGKTTTIQMLLGNVRPTGGSGTLLGKPLGHTATKQHIGFLPEKFQFHDFLTAEEFLHFHGRLVGMDWPDLRRRTDEVLETVGLSDRRKSQIREFSKGMQQRIGLAQAILHQPALVILDEPTSALDPIGRRDVRDVIRHLKQRGATVMLNSHLLSEVEMACDSVAIINKGRVVRHGTLDSLLLSKSVVEVEARDVTQEALDALDRFARVISRDADRYTVAVSSDEDIPEVATTLVRHNAKLMQMHYQRESLEEFFIRTIQDDAQGGQR